MGVLHHRDSPLGLATLGFVAFCGTDELVGPPTAVFQPDRRPRKGKAKRSNRYLKESFVVPQAATFKQS
nr:hypothetical protein [Cupriavidus taiwanensis]